MHSRAMKFLMVKHEEQTPLKHTCEWLESRGHSYQFVNLYAGDRLPALSDFDAVILHGGEMNVDQEDKHPWLRDEKKFIRDVIASPKKMLGICLGAQLIAETLGARVSRHPYWEVGWTPVKVPLLNEPLQVFQWHGYSFDIPSGAKRIAEGTTWENQGYQYGMNVAAFQFHPESTDDWIYEAAIDKKPEGEFVQNEHQILAHKHYRQPMTNWYFQFLDSFFGR